MRIGIVAEGNTDFPVIMKIINSLMADAQCKRLSPPPLKGVGGWTSVRAWCRRNRKTLKAKLSLRKIDILILQIDADVAGELKIAEPCPPASDTTEKLRKLIIEDWLGIDTIPPYVILCIPSLRIEAWIVEALIPGIKNIECSNRIEEIMIYYNAITERVRRNKKSTRKYKELAKITAKKLDIISAVCTEADHFRQDIENAFNNPLT
ncbi:MAG: hypothetical protein P9X24_02695 [Candidatus Hatepunaea meridiana]|nr:hypothetical protein [Candidatus Hatepunaea meridiana]